MWIKVGLLFAVYVSLSTSLSIEAGWGGSSGNRCTTEFDEVWEEKCETVYEDSCSVDYRTECVPTSERQCTWKEEQVCSVISTQKCTSVPVPRCNVVNDRVCTTVPSCSIVHDKVCDLQSNQVCRVEYDQVCTEISEKRCKQVPIADPWPSDPWPTVDPWVSPAPAPSGGLKGLLLFKGKGGKGGVWKRSVSEAEEASTVNAADSDERSRRATEVDADARLKRSFKGEKGWNPAPAWTPSVHVSPPPVKYTTECWDEPRQHCKQVPRRECTDVPKEVCKVVANKVCNDVEKCKDVPRKECTNDYKDVCHNVPSKQCNAVPREVCVNVPSKACREVPHETCVQVPGKSCQKLLVKRPRKVCPGSQRTRKLEGLESSSGHSSSSIGESVSIGSAEFNSRADNEF